MEITVGHLFLCKSYEGSAEKPSRTGSEQRKRSTALFNVLLSCIASCFSMSEAQKES